MQHLNNKNISFIGGGNMAQALISGLLNNGVKPQSITVSDPDAEKRKVLSQKGLNTVDANTNASDAIINADIVILAVKPQVMATVVQSFAASLTNQLIISVAAGLTISSLSNMLNGYTNIIRTMPNTPAMIQTGAAGLFAPAHITDDSKQLAFELLSCAGLAIWVNSEDDLHAVTAVSGSAPAYFFLFIESIIKGGEQLGLNTQQASQLAMQTALGAAKMCIESEDTPEVLRAKVTSPNGTTQAAIESMQANNIEKIICDAMQACNNRSIELSKS